MKNKLIIALFTALLAVALVAGCSNLTGPDTLGAPAGKGTLTRSIKGAGGGRTIMPLVSYEATITGGAATIVTPLLAGPNVLALAAGTYDIAVTASIDGVVIATGSATGVVVAADAAGNATIELELNDELTGKGTFKWDLSDFAGDKKVTVYKMSVDSVDGPGYVEITKADGSTFAGYNDIKQFDMPASTDLAGYTSLVVTLKAFNTSGAAVTPGDAYGNLHVAADILNNGTSTAGDFGWNATGGIDAAANTSTYTLTTAMQIDYGSTGTVKLKAKNTTMTKIQVSSIKFTGAGKSDIELISSASDGYVAGPPIYSADIESTPVADAATTATGSLELDTGVYYVEFEVGDVSWSEVLWVAAGGAVSEYLPSFEDVFTGTAVEKLEDIVIAAIEAGTIDFTVPELSAIGVAGVTTGNLGDVKAAVTDILALEDNEAPADLAGLKVLIDAALVATGAVNVDPSNQTAANTAIGVFIKNATPAPTVDWAKWTDDYSVKITVGDYTFTVYILPQQEFIEELTLAESYAVYKFTLPATLTYGDFKEIKVNYKMDAANLEKATRSLRLHGNYGDLTKFDYPSYEDDEDNTVTGEYPHFAFDASNAAYIYDDVGPGAIAAAGAAADTWFTITYKLVNNNPNGSFDATNNKPADTATGPFYFGIGIPGGSAGSASTPKTQQVKNITMVHKTDPSKNVVTSDFYGFVGKIDTSADPNGWYYACKREVIYNPNYGGVFSPINVDVSKIVTTGQSSNPFGTPPSTAAGGSGGLDITFTADNQGAGFILTKAQTGAAFAATSYTITINGSIVSDSATSGDQFRIALGLITTGQDWNGSAASGNAALASLATSLNNDYRSRGEARYSHFILQHRNANEITVNIQSITIQPIR
jgi:hypothetical protein